jgi:biotin carboxylase
MRILVLSTTTGYQLRSFGDAAERLGIELTFGTDRCHALEDPWQDDAVAVRFDDEDASVEAILESARTRPISGLVAVGDRPVELAARAARALGLAGNPPGAAAASANKLLARAYFEAAGLLTPAHFAVGLDIDPRDVAERASYPAVIKPVGLSGSRGVMRVDSPDALLHAFERLRRLLMRPDVLGMRLRSGGTILIEEFMEGREYALEGVLTHGSLRVLAIFDKPDPLDGPFFEETVYVTPSALKIAAAHAMTSEVDRAVKSLGLWHGPIHAECRVTPRGVFVLEVAARPIGGLCSRVLRFGREGHVSFEELLLRHAGGERVDALRRERAAAAVMMVPIPKRGIFKRVAGVERARAIPFVDDVRVTAKADQLLEPLPEAGSYLGFIFARAPRAAEAEQAVRDAHRQLSFAIEPAIPVVS